MCFRCFRYVVETERRFYLSNDVNVDVREVNGSVFFEVQMKDAWVWDMFRPGPVFAARSSAHFP